jgi:hypothetical protein
VLIVPEIPLAIGGGVTALPFTAKANPAGAGGLAVQAARNESAGPCTAATVERPGHALTRIVNADFARPAETGFTLSAFENLAADIREFLRIGPSGLDRPETIPRHALEFTHFDLPKNCLPYTYRSKGVGLEKRSHFLDYSIGGNFDKYCNRPIEDRSAKLHDTLHHIVTVFVENSITHRVVTKIVIAAFCVKCRILSLTQNAALQYMKKIP